MEMMILDGRDPATKRYQDLAAREPETMAAVASNLGLSLSELADLFHEPDKITVRIISQIADNFRVPASFLVFGNTEIDFDTLRVACMDALGDVSLDFDPIPNGIVDAEPDRFFGRRTRNAWKLAIASHLAGIIGGRYAALLLAEIEGSSPDGPSSRLSRVAW